jgi:hypothetical protein
MVYAKSQGAYLGNVCIPSWTKFSTLVTLELHAMKIVTFLGKKYILYDTPLDQKWTK